MSLKRKNILSTKANIVKLNAAKKSKFSTKFTKSNEAHFFTQHSSKIYSDQTGKFLYVARSGNQYLMIVYVLDANLILDISFKSKTKSQSTEAY